MNVTNTYILKDSVGPLDPTALDTLDEALALIEHYPWDEMDENDPENLLFSTDENENILVSRESEGTFWVEIHFPPIKPKKLFGFIPLPQNYPSCEMSGTTPEEMKKMVTDFFDKSRETLVNTYCM